MAQADEADQGAADQLVAAAGRGQPADRLRDRAPAGRRAYWSRCPSRTTTRPAATPTAAAELAAGPAPGQGGDFADRFELGQVTADGRVVTLRLDPVEGTRVLSDLSTGPVLFATC